MGRGRLKGLAILLDPETPMENLADFILPFSVPEIASNAANARWHKEEAT